MPRVGVSSRTITSGNITVRSDNGITPATTTSGGTSSNVEVANNATSDKHCVYEQSIASNIWTITHNLNKKPSITVVDSADNVVEGAREYINQNTVIVRFNGAFKGKAYLN